MSIPSFNRTGATTITATATSTTYELPGSADDAAVLITLTDPGPVLVLLGDSSVTVSITTGIAVMPDRPLALARSSAGYIAIMTTGGQPRANVNVASGS